MIVEIDFTTDTVILWSKVIEADNIKYFPAPDDYDPLFYDYIPQTPGEFDSNGFIKKEVNMNSDPFNI
jgi:hypothetical protein